MKEATAQVTAHLKLVALVAESVLVETELFPRGAIEFYTAKNMGWPIAEDDTAKWLTPGRGGEQGDYREGMQKKIANVVDCLRTHPHSKRAIIPIPFATEGSANVSPPRIISLHAHVSRRALNAEQNQLTHNSQVDWTNAGQTKYVSALPPSWPCMVLTSSMVRPGAAVSFISTLPMESCAALASSAFRTQPSFPRTCTFSRLS